MKLKTQSFVVSLHFLLGLTSAAHAQVNNNTIQVREAFSRPPPQLDGIHVKLWVVEVTLPPGGSSSPDRDPCPVFVYVIAGAIRRQIQGESEKTYHAGESFYEAPNRVHAISATLVKTNRLNSSPTSSAITPKTEPVQ